MGTPMVGASTQSLRCLPAGHSRGRNRQLPTTAVMARFHTDGSFPPLIFVPISVPRWCRPRRPDHARGRSLQDDHDQTGPCPTQFRVQNPGRVQVAYHAYEQLQVPAGGRTMRVGATRRTTATGRRAPTASAAATAARDPCPTSARVRDGASSLHGVCTFGSASGPQT